jgi:hypothetical protein
LSTSRFDLNGRQPVFGLVSVGGPLSGALVRDIRLANDLARRGYRVHLWWAVDRPKHSTGLRPEITQHWLFSGLRYVSVGPFVRPRGIKDHIGRVATAVFPDSYWVHQVERRSWAVDSFMRGMVERVCQGVEADGRLIRRFAEELEPMTGSVVQFSGNAFLNRNRWTDCSKG